MSDSDEGLVNILNNLFMTAQGLIIMGIIIMALIFVVMTWTRTRSLVPTLGALLLGAMVAWGANAFSWFADNIGADVQHFDEQDASTTTLSRPTDRGGSSQNDD